MRLYGPLKSLEGAQRLSHRFRRNKSRLEYACTKPRNFAIFGNGPQVVRHDFRDLQPAGIRSNVDGGKNWHGVLEHSGW
jgi:hypothetical protein